VQQNVHVNTTIAEVKGAPNMISTVLCTKVLKQSISGFDFFLYH